MDIAPHTIILSVPWDRIFKSQPESALQMHWSAEMAVRLLVERSAGPASAWAPWLAALPAHVATPLEWSAAEVAAVGDPGIQSEVLGMQACITACWGEAAEAAEGGPGGGDG
ncbi:SET domain-containing protein, partial [Haematococcus lacustris]